MNYGTFILHVFIRIYVCIYYIVRRWVFSLYATCPCNRRKGKYNIILKRIVRKNFHARKILLIIFQHTIIIYVHRACIQTIGRFRLRITFDLIVNVVQTITRHRMEKAYCIR